MPNQTKNMNHSFIEPVFPTGHWLSPVLLRCSEQKMYINILSRNGDDRGLCVEKETQEEVTREDFSESC